VELRLPEGVACDRFDPRVPGGGEQPVREALARPRGGLEPPVRGRDASHLCLLFPDPTRDPRMPRLLLELLGELRRRGWDRESATLLMATGMHRHPDRRELDAHLRGLEGWRVEVHRADDEAALVDLGTTSRGTPVRLNRLAVESDVLVSVSAASFHYFAGYGGGRKLVLPGVAGRDTILANHRLSLVDSVASCTLHPACQPGNLEGNPVHLDMVEGASLAPPHFALVAVMHPGQGPQRVHAGEPQEALRAAAEDLENLCSFEVEAPYPLVIASAGGHPGDVNLLQAHKTLRHAARALAPGGTLLCLAACEQGWGSDGFREALDRDDLALTARSRYVPNAQTAVSTRELLSSGRIAIHSRMESRALEARGFEAVPHPQEFLEETLAGSDAGAIDRCLVLPHAGAVLPRPAPHARPREARS
jgi:nickel-dependent lactate racemase